MDFSNGADPIYVTYGEPYGPLPELDQSKYARGWTSDEGGSNIITEDSIVNFIDKQTLYRQYTTRTDIALTAKDLFGSPGAVRVEYDGQPHAFNIQQQRCEAVFHHQERLHRPLQSPRRGGIH